MAILRLGFGEATEEILDRGTETFSPSQTRMFRDVMATYLFVNLRALFWFLFLVYFNVNYDVLFQVIIYCDLHGHSRKPNVFMYGCTADPKMASMRNFIEERLFPWMMSQKVNHHTSFLPYMEVQFLPSIFYTPLNTLVWRFSCYLKNVFDKWQIHSLS